MLEPKLCDDTPSLYDISFRKRIDHPGSLSGFTSLFANKKDALGEASSLYMIIIILKGRKYEILLGEIVHTGKIPPAC